MINGPDIKSLFNRIAANDAVAFEMVFKAYYDNIYSTAIAYGKSHEMAQDVAQQVFLKLWERREELPGVINPEGWLHTAARYTTKDLLEREIVRKNYSKEVSGRAVENNNSAVDILIIREREALVKTALKALPPRQYEAYQLSREEGLSYEQIGERLGIGKETVKEHIGKALKSLYSFLRQHKDKLVFWIFYLMMVF